jgi:hypothetical protein
MRLASIVLAALLTTACAGGGPDPRARVVTQDFEIHGERVGAGAAVVLDDAPHLRDIALRIRFFAGDEVVRTEHDEIPFCPAICQWGSSYVIEDPDERSIDRVSITVESTGAERGGDVTWLDSHVRGDRVETQLDGKRGRGSIIALRDGQPIFGVPFETREGERRKLRVPADDFPDNDGLITVFYAGETGGAGVPGAD